MTNAKSVYLTNKKDKNWAWHTFSINGKTEYILGFSDQTISAITTQLHCCSTKAAIDNKEMNECGCVPTFFVFTKKGGIPDLAHGCNLPIPGVKWQIY